MRKSMPDIETAGDHGAFASVVFGFFQSLAMALALTAWLALSSVSLTAPVHAMAVPAGQDSLHVTSVEVMGDVAYSLVFEASSECCTGNAPQSGHPDTQQSACFQLCVSHCSVTDIPMIVEPQPRFPSVRTGWQPDDEPGSRDTRPSVPPPRIHS